MKENDPVARKSSTYAPETRDSAIRNNTIKRAVSFDLKLLETLCARLCHDVINPVSAVNNGIELLREQPQDAEITALVTENAQAAQMRLKLFRVAFGRCGVSACAPASSGDGFASDGFAGLRHLLHDTLPAKKITLDWPYDPQPARSQIPAILSKLVLNMVLAAAEELPKGGQLKIADQETETGNFILTITACDPQGSPNRNFPEYFRTKHPDQPTDVTDITDVTDSKHAHALLAIALSNHINATIDIQEPDHPHLSPVLRLHAPIQSLA